MVVDMWITGFDAPDTAQMNEKVREMIKEALLSEGVEEVFKLGGKEQDKDINIFSDEYMARIDKIKLPNTKIKTLQQLLKKAFYDILKAVAEKYDFEYPHEKLIILSKAVKKIVDDKAKYTDWSQRNDIKAELKVDLILVLDEHKYPPVPRDDVFKEIFEQAENFRKYRGE